MKNIKHTTTHYYVQSIDTKNEDNQPAIVGHTKDEETGEIYYKFMSKKSAERLMKEEIATAPEFSYRIVKLVNTFEATAWNHPTQSN